MTVDDSKLATWASIASGDGASGVPVPPLRQRTAYNCGPSLLAAVLTYFGKPVDEDELAVEAGTTPNGTSFAAMIETLQAHGLDVEQRDDLNPEEIKRLLGDGALIVLALQAWRDELPPLGGYTNEWNSGHYVTPVAVDDETILFHDPSVAGRRAFLTRDEFAKRWHDIDSSGVFDRGFGLVVRGAGPVVWRRVMKKLASPVPMG